MFDFLELISEFTPIFRLVLGFDKSSQPENSVWDDNWLCWFENDESFRKRVLNEHIDNP